jgi:hypothetical protein
MKRYALYYTSDRRDPRSNIGEYLHGGWRARSLRIIYQYMAQIKRDKADENPRDFFFTDQENACPLAPENRVYL